MAETTGATVHLDKVPLKYPTLSPWEIYLSESQERMVLAIDPKHKKEIQKISNTYNVEATEIGIFDGTKKLNLLYNTRTIADLSMDFLHNGLPTRHMTGVSQKTHIDEKYPSPPTDYKNLWLKVLSHGNVCSKEPIVRLYDHNVMGTTALHPFSGITQDGPNDGSVVKPFLDKPYGLITTHGLNPALNAIDPYWGSVWAITEAVSNYVAVGGNLRDAALIDNFIWPYPDEASLADLDTSVDACVRLSTLLRLPFVSGKDSLSSTYRFEDGNTLKIPPVLLVSVFGKINDVEKTLSSDFKKSDSLIVLVGQPDSRNLGGTTYFDVTQSSSASVPKVDLATLPKTLTAISKGAREQTILSAHDISEGGIAAALAEMSFGGGFGSQVNLKNVPTTRPDFLFFNETAGTFLVEVADKKTAEKLFNNVPHVILGKTNNSKEMRVTYGKELLVNATIEELKTAWQRPMKEYFA
jgi:phosphoribosylformylglycinamidine synthase